MFEENNELKNEINRLGYHLEELMLDKQEENNKKDPAIPFKIKLLEEENSSILLEKQYFEQLAIRFDKSYYYL